VQYDNGDSLNQRQKELELTLSLKRIGGDEAKLQDQELIQRVEAQLADLDPANKEQKNKITALHKDKNRFFGKYFA
jgi:type I restriction enzyme M protein